MLLSRAIVLAYAIVVFRLLIIYKVQEHSVELQSSGILLSDNLACYLKNTGKKMDSKG